MSAAGFEITCVNKNARGLIVRVGGVGWSMPVHNAIVSLISQQLRLHIRVNDTFRDVGVRGDSFDSYLVLEPDGVPLHDLPDLASCG